MKFLLEIEIDPSAPKHYALDDTPLLEIGCILKRLSDEFRFDPRAGQSAPAFFAGADGAREGWLSDVNGKTVGSWSIREPVARDTEEAR